MALLYKDISCLPISNFADKQVIFANDNNTYQSYYFKFGISLFKP